MSEQKWGALANQSSPSNYDAVAFGVQSWGLKGPDREPEGGAPALFIDWEDFPEHQRPEILVDVLCMSLRRLEDGGPILGPLDNRGATVTTSEAHAMATIKDLWSEQLRQTGEAVRLEDCCYLSYLGYYWVAGYLGFHIEWCVDDEGYAVHCGTGER